VIHICSSYLFHIKHAGFLIDAERESKGKAAGIGTML
jgi:hypothetical protein